MHCKLLTWHKIHEIIITIQSAPPQMHHLAMATMIKLECSFYKKHTLAIKLESRINGIWQFP